MSKRFTITVKRAYADQNVRIGVGYSTYGEPCADGKITGDITIAEARALAASILAEADRAEAVAAKKAASEERRAKWREREIAAGRMRIMSAAEVFGRRL